MSAHSPAATGALSGAATVRGRVPLTFTRPRDADWFVQPFAWPLPFPATADVLDQQVERFVRFVVTLPTFEERAVVLGSITCLRSVLGRIETALCAQAATAAGIAFEERTPELEAITGIIGGDEVPLRTEYRLRPPPRFVVLRNVKQTWMQSGVRLPFAYRPGATTVIGRSPLLMRQIAQSDEASQFRHTAEFFASRQPHLGTGAYRVDTEALAMAIADEMTDIEALAPEYRRRLQPLLLAECRGALSQAAHHLNMLSSRSDIPLKLWSGTGGNFMARLLGLESMRRGGEVVRHAHGSPSTSSLMRNAPFQLIELMVSTRFCVAGENYARAVSTDGALNLVPEWQRASVVAGKGVAVATRPGRKSRPPAGKRLKVLYAPTLFRGMLQYLSPDVPDPVYLDWQRRLVAQLQELPVELVCKTHPLLLDALDRHPLGDLITLSNTPFETLLQEVDVVLLDYYKTSTFSQAASTDLPMVLLDINGLVFRSKFEAPLHRRCRILRAGYDELNRPVVATDALEEALFQPPPEFEQDDLIAGFSGTH